MARKLEEHVNSGNHHQHRLPPMYEVDLGDFRQIGAQLRHISERLVHVQPEVEITHYVSQFIIRFMNHFWWLVQLGQRLW